MGRKLNPDQQSRLLSPITTALIAMRLGRCTDDHAHDVLAQVFIAYRMAQLVPRHRHLQPELLDAEAAVHSMLERHSKRTIKDGFVNGTPDEIDSIHLASKIYAALLKTTPLSTYRRALININDKVKRK